MPNYLIIISNMNVFISCTKSKEDYETTARHMYIPSAMFRKSLTYAKKVLKAEHIYILSAKYHLLPLNKSITPYNEYLGDFSEEDKEKWYEITIDMMKKQGIDFNEKAVFLAGDDYCSGLVGEFSNAECPFKHKGQGDILHWLTTQNEGVEEIQESGFIIPLSDYLRGI